MNIEDLFPRSFSETEINLKTDFRSFDFRSFVRKGKSLLHFF